MQSTHPDFRPPGPDTELRVDALLGKLTLSEKIRLLGGQHKRGATFPVERLGIPELKMSDGPMGVHWWCEHATAYPALFLAAASFDTQLWYSLGQSLGRDCRARGVHILLAPGVNLYRSPLCGRNFEYAGEDPFLAAEVAVAVVKGVQSQGVSATIKHFACNFQEYDRHHVSTEVDDRTLHEIYLPAFEAAVRRGGTGALMTAYNLVNGLHCSEDPRLLRDLLKERWGFQGIVMSDWISVYSDEKAANAGLDLEMPTAQYLSEERLLPLIERGVVAEATIDDKVRRLLRLAVCFGWLDRPQLDETIPHDSEESRRVALEVARGGIVLLKNEGFLPLDVTRTKRIAVLGAGAHPAVFSGGGSAYTTPKSSVSVLEGLRALIGDRAVLTYARGPEPNPAREVFATSEFHCELGKGLVGEYFDNPDLAGPPIASRLDEYLNFRWGAALPLPGITAQNYSARWHGTFSPKATGKHVIYSRSHDSVYQIRIDGKAIIDTFAGERNGLHTGELDLEEGRIYEIEVLWRKTRYWGGMQVGYECIENLSESVAECVSLARDSDCALLCVGFDNVSESEGFDRSFAMNAQLEELVLAVSAVQPNCVVVLTAGGNVDMRRWLPQVKGLLFVGYPGQEGGSAISEILLGDLSPSGKLPATFERKLSDRSSFDCYSDDDHDLKVTLTDGVFTGYRHADARGIEPQFPFGFGLSYTQFTLEDAQVSETRVSVGKSVIVSVTVVNVGARAGAEVVQVYVKDPSASVPRPPQELKGFAKVELLPGERKRVSIELPPSAFAFFDTAKDDFIVEPGAFELRVGTSSRDISHVLSLEVG